MRGRHPDAGNLQHVVATAAVVDVPRATEHGRCHWPILVAGQPRRDGQRFLVKEPVRQFYTLLQNWQSAERMNR